MKTKILLVEDDINLGDVLCDYLELQDHEVVRAMDGVEGLEIFKLGNFDLLILDVMLPRKDGFTPVSYTHLDVYKRQFQRYDHQIKSAGNFCFKGMQSNLA